MIHLDFETRSEVDIRQAGAMVYAQHPSTEVLCLSWATTSGETCLWYPDKFGMLCDDIRELYAAFEVKPVLAAFNSWFERMVWEYIMVPRHAAPTIDANQWYCVMGQSKAHSLPGSLEDVGAALRLSIQKDKEGRALMLKMCKPRRPTKNNPSIWHETLADLERLGEYCRRDVETERLIHTTLPELTAQERAIWLVDQEMNYRGFAVDHEAIDAILPQLKTMGDEAAQRLAILTHGQVTAPSQVQRIISFLAARSVYVPDCQSDTIKEFLDGDDDALPPDAREVLEIRQTHGLASVKKFQTMKASSARDGRLHGCLTYCGAARTRRWSGTRVQPQNFARGFELHQNAENVITLIKKGELDTIDAIFGSPIKAISDSLRGIIVSAPGHDLIASDYSSIEAVLTAVLANVTLLIEDFENGRSPYITMAVKIYNKLYDEISKAERFFGKQAVLGLGYMMGARKYAATCEKYGRPIELDFAEHVVNTYRSTYYQLPAFWKQIDRDAKSALTNNRAVWRKHYAFMPDKLGLKMVLPNGSERFYIDAKIVMQEKFGTTMPSLTYMGQNQTTRKWERLETYGGKLLENLVQSTARELQAEAVLALEKAGYRPVLQVHDEIICEVPEGFGSVEEVEHIMSNSSPWAAGWPVKAAGGWRGKRYRK